jgi:ABC-type uncharacterized transport system ATPase subunit
MPMKGRRIEIKGGKPQLLQRIPVKIHLNIPEELSLLLDLEVVSQTRLLQTLGQMSKREVKHRIPKIALHKLKCKMKKRGELNVKGLSWNISILFQDGMRGLWGVLMMRQLQT